LKLKLLSSVYCAFEMGNLFCMTNISLFLNELLFRSKIRWGKMSEDDLLH